jgi:hypothetical protein
VEGRSAEEEVRYRLLESGREYALEQLRLQNELEEARRIGLIITIKRPGQFFRETGRPVTGAPLPVTPEDLARFGAVPGRYGYWNATPEDNAAVGIHLSFSSVVGRRVAAGQSREVATIAGAVTSWEAAFMASRREHVHAQESSSTCG